MTDRERFMLAVLVKASVVFVFFMVMILALAPAQSFAHSLRIGALFASLYLLFVLVSRIIAYRDKKRKDKARLADAAPPPSEGSGPSTPSSGATA